MNFTSILYEKHGGVAKVSMNRPEVMNALIGPIVEELTEAFRLIAADEEVRAVVLTGADRAFCAGGDVSRFLKGFDARNSVEYMESVQTCALSILNLKKPVVAMVNGAAVGAGLSLMLVCDMAIAADTAKFGSGFVGMGLAPDLAAAYFLPRVVGLRRAQELFYTGRMVDAQEAVTIGLVNRVTPPEQLEAETMGLAERLAKGPSLALGHTKRLLSMGQDMDVKTLLETESVVQGICLLSEDCGGAVNAFLNKGRYEFKGR